MKKIMLAIFCIAFYLKSTPNNPICTIDIQSRWENLESRSQSTIFNGKWILVATATFKRTSASKEPIFLNQLQFSWNGPYIKTLNASLYKRTTTQKFSPIEENLICDGKWNSKSSELYFQFPEPKRLDPVTTFYIVVTIPEELESVLQLGSFNLIRSSLPEELQPQDPFQLSFTIHTPRATYLS